MSVNLKSLTRFGVPILTGALSFELIRVSGLALAVALGTFAVHSEVKKAKASRQARLIEEAWPAVLESLVSAATAGMSLLEAMRDLAEADELEVAKYFRDFCFEVDSGVGLAEAFTNLKSSLATASSDFTIELLRSVNELGSIGYVEALGHQLESIRNQIQLSAELKAKQGWVIGSAKLAVVAPWLIVAVLALRAENADVYSSIMGTTVLLIGIGASALALKLVYQIGELKVNPRVFA